MKFKTLSESSLHRIAASVRTAAYKVSTLDDESRKYDVLPRIEVYYDQPDGTQGSTWLELMGMSRYEVFTAVEALPNYFIHDAEGFGDYENVEDESLDTIVDLVDAIRKFGVFDYIEPFALSWVYTNGALLRFIDEQTEEICLAAVRNWGYALQYVKEQTEEICLAAVQQDGLALQYVEEQTFGICVAATLQDKRAWEFVDESVFAEFVAESASDGE